MLGDISEINGWIFVDIDRPADWKLPTFFPLVDATFRQIRLEYETKPRKIAFDLSGLEYIDSTMISLFLQATRLTTPAQNAIIAGNERTHDLLCLLGIDKLCLLYPSRQEWQDAN